MNTKIFKKGNFMRALHMLCIKKGWQKEYSWYILGRYAERDFHEQKKKFIKKAVRLLSLNYDGIHNGDNPALSKRLLPESNPNSKPLRYPKDWRE